jgi:hypothetical protein
LSVELESPDGHNDTMMDPEQRMGALYPFSLSEKLARITENSRWYSEADSTPWGRAIIPLEMVSVLVEYTSPKAKLRPRQRIRESA